MTVVDRYLSPLASDKTSRRKRKEPRRKWHTRCRNDMARAARETFDEAYAHLSSKCESPIELDFLAALIEAMSGQFGRPEAENDHLVCGGSVRFGSQHEIGPYRADFYIEAGKRGEPWLRIVVECDGHDYHERTKEQAARDKSRDRWMTLQHITVLRFTGSEIYKNAQSCAEQIVNIMCSRASRGQP